MKNPEVLLPAGFDQAEAWAECVPAQDALAKNPDNFGAAMCADPGVCRCPACWTYYWCWGVVHKCTECGFIYPTNAWAAFSWGTSGGYKHEQRMNHPYYRYASEHHGNDGWPETSRIFEAIDWRSAVGDFPLDGELWRL